MRILLCIPAFNEESIIGDLVKKSLRYVDHVVVCDDGSSDLTAINAENAGAYVIRHEKNKGKGAALKSLFKYARHHTDDVILTMDGDGQFIPDEIPKLCKPIIEEKFDIVVGYRFDNNEEMPSYRVFGNKVIDKVSNLASKLPFRDTQSGFRAYSKHAIDLIKFKNDGFGADSEILIDAVDKKLRITEEKITVLYKIGRRTSTQNPISHASNVIGSLIELILIRHPLKYVGITGLCSLAIGIVTSIYVLTVFNETRYFSIGFSLISLSLIAFGVMMTLVAGLLYSFNRQLHNR